MPKAKAPSYESRRSINGYSLIFVWSGGPYVEIHFDTVGSTAFEIINVWDYEKDEPRIPFTQKALGRAAARWVAENEDSLDNYWENRPNAPRSGAHLRVVR